jgi:hypothetical protein
VYGRFNAEWCNRCNSSAKAVGPLGQAQWREDQAADAGTPERRRTGRYGVPADEFAIGSVNANDFDSVGTNNTLRLLQDWQFHYSGLTLHLPVLCHCSENKRAKKRVVATTSPSPNGAVFASSDMGTASSDHGSQFSLSGVSGSTCKTALRLYSVVKQCLWSRQKSKSTA